MAAPTGHVDTVRELVWTSSPPRGVLSMKPIPVDETTLRFSHSAIIIPWFQLGEGIPNLADLWDVFRDFKTVGGLT